MPSRRKKMGQEKQKRRRGKKAFQADILHLEQKAAQCLKRRFEKFWLIVVIQ